MKYWSHNDQTELKRSILLFSRAVKCSIKLLSLILVQRSKKDGGVLCFQNVAVAVKICKSNLEVLQFNLQVGTFSKYAKGFNGIHNPSTWWIGHWTRVQKGWMLGQSHMEQIFPQQNHISDMYPKHQGKWNGREKICDTITSLFCIDFSL